jgi:Zn-dependent M28 family amino/carboxypeptidase
MFDQVNDSAGRIWRRRFVFAAPVVILLASLIWVSWMIQMPLKSYPGQLPPLTSEQLESANHLSQHVKYLSETIGERNLARAGTLPAATDYFQNQLKQSGYAVSKQTYRVEGREVSNLEVRLPGSNAAGQTVVVGAHYDSAVGAPGADDNGSGVAALLELARLWHGSTHRKSIRLVLFVNEEPPYFQTENMGSLVYARQLRSEHVSVSAMISLEMLGYYSDVPGSQKYPALLGLFYPDRGKFIAFVGNPESRTLLRQAIRKFRETTEFPSEGIAAPADWPGVGWSDQWSFWREQFPAIMITDTAMFRYPYYHTPDDTSNWVNFEKMARVISGVQHVVGSLATDR